MTAPRITVMTDKAAQGRPRDGVLAYLPALALALVGLAALSGHALMRGGASGQYLVLMRPGLPDAVVMDMVYRAGGGVMAFGWLPGAVLTLSDQPDFPDRIRHAGAWGVLAAPGNLGCAAPARGGAA
ncbi:MAG: hypothetical protein MEQ74_05755 [Paracoccus sp.]|nr:hypothetical protein [Paracoccus sp. (in: a-proteobacteria)]